MAQEEKDLKKALRLLRQARRGLVPGDKRTDLNQKIKDLKSKIDMVTGMAGVTDKKRDLITKILELEPSMKQVNLFKHSEADLEFHLLKIQGKVKNREDYFKPAPKIPTEAPSIKIRRKE